MRTRPDTAPVASTDHLDSDTLAELAMLDAAGSTTMTTRLVTLFVEDAELALTGITTALDEGDLPHVRMLAHKLKGSALTVGATRLAAFLNAMATSEGDALAGDVHAARAELRAVAAALQQWLAGRTPEET